MRICLLLGTVGTALFIASALTPLPNLLSRWLGTPSRLEPADAIVVLGSGGVRNDGTLSNKSLRLAVQGILLQRKGLAPLLVFSGPDGPDGVTEAEARARLAHELGVSPAAILTEGTGRTTREEATRVGAVLRARGIRRILLVTDREGIGRARGVFEHAGFEVLPVPTDTSGGRLDVIRSLLQESLAWLYYRAADYL